MVARSDEPAATADREIVVTRILDAPRDLVFEAWTNPEHVGQWFGPNGFTTTIHEIDVRPGGVWRFTMHGPDGTDYKNRIDFLEVVRPERLVYEHSDEESDAPLAFHVTVTFTDRGGRTELTMRSLFASAADRERVEKLGATEGAIQTLDRLRDHLITMQR